MVARPHLSPNKGRLGPRKVPICFRIASFARSVGGSAFRFSSSHRTPGSTEFAISTSFWSTSSAGVADFPFPLTVEPLQLSVRKRLHACYQLIKCRHSNEFRPQFQDASHCLGKQDQQTGNTSTTRLIGIDAHEVTTGPDA